MRHPPATVGRRAHAQRGVTLVELVVALTVLAIISFAAAPSFSGMLVNHRTNNAAMDLAGALSLARSEAVKRNASVTLAASGVWASGWNVTAGAETVRAFGPYDGIAVTASGGNALSMGNDGRPTVGGQTFQVAPAPASAGTATVCVQLSGTGRVAMATGACS